VEFVFRQRSPQGLAHFPFSAIGGLLAFETDFAHDVVNVIHNAFDDDGDVGGAGLLEDFGLYLRR
jgi:hypothetical protein